MPNFHQRGAFSFSLFLLHLITHPPTFVPDLALSACFVFVCGKLVSSSLLFEIKMSLSFCLLVCCRAQHDRTAPSSNDLYSNTLLSNNHSSLPHFYSHLYIKSEALFPSPDAFSFHSTILLPEPLLPTSHPNPPISHSYPTHDRTLSHLLPFSTEASVMIYYSTLPAPSGHCTFELFKSEKVERRSSQSTL